MTTFSHQDLNRLVLREIPLFKDLPSRALDRLLTCFNLLVYPKGYRILKQGTQTNNAFYLIRSGQVCVSIRDKQGGDRILHIFERGSIFGEMEILTGAPVSASVETLFDTECWVLSRHDFNKALEQNPQMGVQLSILLSQRLAEQNRISYLRPTRHVISVAGAGSSEESAFLSLNLAATLAGETRSPVCLVDMDSYRSPMEKLLGHRPIREVSQVLTNGPYLRTEAIDDATPRVSHGFSVIGLKPARSERASLDSSIIPRLLAYLRARYTYIIIDVGQAPDQLTLKALEQSDAVLRIDGGRWPRAPERPGLYEDILVHIGPREEGIHADASVHLSASALRDFLNRGRPAISAEPRGTLAREISSLGRRARNAQVGLALGSGTALGWCHAGVLKVLDREGIPIDMIAGSSMGAGMGALYAMGMSTDDIYALAESVDRKMVNSWFDYNLPFPKNGLIRGELLEDYLHAIFGDTEFKHLPIPFVAIGTDVVTGGKVVMREGPIYKAIRASSSIPGIFRMAEWQGRYMLDGGVFEPVPVQTLREAGIPRVIAVNTSQDPRENASYLERKPKHFNIFDIILRSSEIFLHRRSRSHESQGDVNINPEIERISWRELWRSQELIECGEAAAEAVLPEINKLLEED